MWVDLAMNEENLKEDKKKTHKKKNKTQKQARFYPCDKNTQPKTNSYSKNFTV